MSSTEASGNDTHRRLDDLRLNVVHAATEECNSCCGEGGENEEVDCDECRATGTVECVSCWGDTDDCDDCDGSGTHDCDDCRGTGTTTEWAECGYCDDGESVDGNDVADQVEDLLTALANLSRDGFNVLAADWCCLNCSYSAANDARPLIGFHQQDVEAARIPNGVYLFHDFTLGDRDADTNRDTALAALADAGLTVEWDRTANSRILVTI